jgi:tRNA threonylcarbamoyladenosine biosynthesis protein TsaE
MPGLFLPCEIVSSSPEETIAAGEQLALLLSRGSVLALYGGLGVGKTCFVKGIAHGLGVPDEVTSPTYTIISEYAGTILLYHIDAYRLTGDDDFDNLGIDDLFDQGVTVIEWSEHIPGSIPSDAMVVEITIIGQNRRKIVVHRGVS